MNKGTAVADILWTTRPRAILVCPRRVSVSSPGSLSWSAVAGEFVQCSELWRLRQREPATYRLAVRHMADFSAADPGHFEPTTGTQNGEIGTQQAGDTSRARPLFRRGDPAVPGQIAGTTAGTIRCKGTGDNPGLVPGRPSPFAMPSGTGSRTTRASPHGLRADPAAQCPGAPSVLHPGVMRMCLTTLRWLGLAAEGIAPAMERVDGVAAAAITRRARARQAGFVVPGAPHGGIPASVDGGGHACTSPRWPRRSPTRSLFAHAAQQAPGRSAAAGWPARLRPDDPLAPCRRAGPGRSSAPPRLARSCRRRSPDADNVIKAIFDGCNGVLARRRAGG